MTSTAVAPEATTVETVPSFVQGEWWTPSAEASAGVPVRDASTGEILATVNTDGLDLAGVVNYGRTVGQRELGKLTFTSAPSSSRNSPST
ncbi:bifunctional aldehyde dehydrogenase/enoyl-CoA hydratase [Arthrobacter sp. Hiyo1]|nr:bifunctional aldehyde dehydrogenase/enoyl-CoA hydratase [Arthrobacter sp. Hiyo1]